MADTGAPYNLPYPLPTDLVIDGAQAIQDLAEAVDDGLDLVLDQSKVKFRASTDATETLNFATGDEIVRSTRAGALAFAGSNYTAGVSKTVVWNGGGTNRTVSFPAGWVFVSFKPTTLLANKRGILSLVCHGTAEADVTAAWAAQP
jgi:hypothetical protein